MGFFSSRKPDDDYANGDKTVVQVIRSRFYGKNKGKEREDNGGGTFVDPASSAAHTLSHPSTSHGNGHVLAASPQKKLGPITRLTHGSPASKTAATNSMAPPSSVRSTSARSAKENVSTIAPPSPRKPADNATMTLAQRLNELASANSDGLLNDDEYRMLRQNLFERFASSSTVPSEAPVVPAIPRHQSQGSESGRTSTTSRPPSNFVVEVPRSPSIRSKGSVSSFFRRSGSNTRRTPAGSKDFSDTSSIFSSTSGTSNIFKLPRLTKKASTSSITSVRTDASRPAADTMSITSRRTGLSLADRGDYNSLPHLPSTSRSTASSIRRFATPPSSFPGAKVLASDPKYTGHVQDVFEEENLKSSGEIKQELAAVDAERKRLMDAFNGLELTTLTKRNQRQGKIHDDGRDLSTWTLIPSQRRGDSDATSVRSGNSVNTTYTGRRVVRQKTSSSLATMSSKPGSLHRKNSVSSMSSGKGMPSTNGGLAPPPVPSLPINVALGGGFNNSSTSINLSRSTGHLPMTSVPEDDSKSASGHSSKSGAQRQRDEADQEMELEMEEIRRRRQEVSTRYEARMEYLRAKLKGAQLHEKLMKK